MIHHSNPDMVSPLDVRESSPNARPRRGRILVVDDIAANRLMLQMFLEPNGFVVEHAVGGEEAVALAAARAYDVILMDLNMPVLDGCAAAMRIRANETTGHHSLILAVTACVGSDTRARCLAAGMDDYFAKPLELRSFSRALTEMIAQRSHQPAAGAPTGHA